MEQYIPKSAVVAQANIEITGCRLAAQQGILTEFGKGKLEALEGIVDFLDTLEVKEVNLEKEIEEHVVDMPMSEFTHESEVDDYWDWARKEFRHFFELGLKTKDK